MGLDPTLKKAALATMGCVSLAALSVAWSSMTKVVPSENSAAVFVVNTVTGARQLCSSTACFDLPPG